MKLTVSEKGVFLDGHEIPQCTQVNLKNISPVDGMEAVLHVDVSDADIQWGATKARETIQEVCFLRGKPYRTVYRTE